MSAKAFIKAAVRAAAVPRQEVEKLRKAITEAAVATGNGIDLLHALRGNI
jgi:hypothetical protein